MPDVIKDVYSASSVIDLLYLLITILSLIKCYKKGFVLSILSMAKWLLAYIITLLIFPRVKPFLKDIIDNEYVLDIGLGVAIFIVVIFFVLMINKGISKAISYTGIGSTCSYPGNMPVLAESDYFTGPLHPSVETYGLTKCVMQQGIKAYKKQYGLKGTTVVFATLYGPHDEFDISRSHVVSALIQKFCDAVKDGKDEVEVWGDGTQTRELIYIDDQIDGLLMASEYEGDLINIGSGIETSIRDLAEMIKRLSGFEGRIDYNTDRFVGVKRKVLNIDEAKESFGWTVNNKMHSLEEGVMKTIIWYRENEQ